MSFGNSKWKDRAVSYLKYHPKVILSFLFGSQAQNRAAVYSDVDIAVYLAKPYNDKDIHSIWNALEDAIGKDVDLIILNTAPPGIAWTSMQGEILVNKSPRLHLELMLEKSRESEDFRGFVISMLEERKIYRRNKDVPSTT